MSKAILVMEMPGNCYDCKYCNGKDSKHPSCALTNYAGGYQKMPVDEIRSSRPIWCPLREEPERLVVTDDLKAYLNWYREGWNACLDRIDEAGEDE